MSPSTQPSTPPPPKGRKRTSLLIGGGIVVLLLGGGVVAFTMRGQKTAEEEKSANDAGSAVSRERSVITLDPFVLNLADTENDRFLRVTVRVVLAGLLEAEGATGEDMVQARLRDRILTVLTAKNAEEITTFEGKEELRAEIASEIAPLVPEHHVIDVLFTEFLVQ